MPKPTTTLSQKKRDACAAIDMPAGTNLFCVVDEAMKICEPEPRDQVEHDQRNDDDQQDVKQRPLQSTPGDVVQRRIDHGP